MYLLCGMKIDSEIDLPEIPPAKTTSASAPDVKIRVGKVPSAFPDGVEISPGCFVGPSDYILHVPQVAGYRVQGGSEITIQPHANALGRDVRGYLMGNIFAVLCHQRQLLPLHASAITHSGGVVAFLAGSGHGKSSTAAHLAKRGFQVFADDICLVKLDGAGRGFVSPAPPWLKLWPDSLKYLGLNEHRLERVFSDEDKFRLPVRENSQPEERILTTLVLLESEKEDAAGSPRFEQVSPLQALPSVMACTHQAYLLQAMGKLDQNFRQCSRLVSHTKVYRLIRPWGFEHINTTVDMVEDLLQDFPAGDDAFRAIPSGK